MTITPPSKVQQEQAPDAPTGDRAEMLSAADRIKSLAVTDVTGAIALSDDLLAKDLRPRERIRLLSARAHALCYANDFDRASRDLAEAAATAERLGLNDEVGPLQLVRVQPLARLGRLEEAEEAARSARAAFERAGPASMLGKAEVNLGIVLRMRGLAADAIACFERATPLLAGDSTSLAAVHSNRAVALLELDRFEAASEAFSAAMTLLKSSGRGHAAAIVTGNIADLLARMGNIDAALTRFDEARLLFADTGAEADSARLLAEEADALFSVGAHVKCLRLLKQAIPVLRSAGLPRELARAELVFGLASLRAGHLSDASAALTHAADAADAAGATLIRAESLIGLAELHAEEGRIDAARDAASQAAEQLCDRPVRRAAALATLSAVAMRRSDPAAALTELDRAEAGFGVDSAPPAPLRVRILHLRAMARRRMGDSAAALEHLRAALATVESFRGAMRADQIRTAYLESSQRLFLDICELAPEVLDSEAAGNLVFDAMERLRARALLDALRGRAAGSPTQADSADAAELAELNALYSSLGPTSSDQPREIERRRVRLRALEAAREARTDRRAARASMDGRRQAPLLQPASLAEVTAWLPEGEVIVSLLPEGDSITAQVIRRGRAELQRGIASRGRVASLCRRFELALAAAVSETRPRGDGTMCRLVRDLAGCLVKPIEPLLAGASHIRLAPFGELQRVPLHVADTMEQRGDRVLSWIPGVSVGLALAEAHRRRGAAGGVAVIGVGDDLAPRIEQEVREVAACHASAQLLVGGDATAAAALRAVSAADLVHLSCHSIFDPDFPMSSRLKLADRWITAWELAEHIRPGATIVLAGCDTGRSDAGAMADPSGLVRGVLASRAAAVLSAAWPLHDDTARRAMVEIHRELAAGRGEYAARLAPAVTRIQRVLHAENTPLERWAALTVTGGLV